MYNPVIDFFLTKGVSIQLLEFIVIVPLVLSILNIARYIIGIKVNANNLPLSIIATFYFFGSALANTNEPNILSGILFGSILIGVIFAVSIASYSLIKPLYLHYFSKLSIVLIVATLSIAGVLAIAEIYDVHTFIALEPLTVAIAIIISEQFTNIYVRTGLKSSISLLTETLMIAIFCYGLFSFKPLQLFLLQYPWITLLTLPLNFLVGKFSGLRLTEYHRFYDLLSNDDHETAEDTEE